MNTLTVNGYPLSFHEQGSGSVLLLIHGSLADYRYWSPQMAPLSAHLRVVAPSLRHHYPEQWDGRGDDYSVAQHAQDLAAFIGALDAGPVHVLGHSRGGLVALQLAFAHPELLRTLILADPAIELEGHARDATADNVRREAAALIRRGEVEAGLELFIDTVSGSGIWSRVNSRRKQVARDNACTLAAQLEDAAPPIGDAKLSELALPTLLIGGERSPAPYPQIIERLAAGLPNAIRHTIDRASHAMNAENVSAFNQAVLAFLERARASPATAS